MMETVTCTTVTRKTIIEHCVQHKQSHLIKILFLQFIIICEELHKNYNIFQSINDKYLYANIEIC